MDGYEMTCIASRSMVEVPPFFEVVCQIPVAEKSISITFEITKAGPSYQIPEICLVHNMYLHIDLFHNFTLADSSPNTVN